MINSATFQSDFRCFTKGDKFDFKPGVNVIVGDQGSGKSTLIELIRLCLEKTKGIDDSSWRGRTLSTHIKDIKDVISLDKDDNTGIVAVDFERESVRDLSQLLYDQMEMQLIGLKSSHGQANLALLDTFLKKILDDKEGKITTIMMDEPDSALSPRSAYLLLGAMHKLATKFKRQVIVSAHNPIIIGGKHPLCKETFWDEVLCLDNKKWLDSNTFLLLQLSPNDLKKRNKGL